jgi:hypothetical protein
MESVKLVMDFGDEQVTTIRKRYCEALVGYSGQKRNKSNDYKSEKKHRRNH